MSTSPRLLVTSALAATTLLAAGGIARADGPPGTCDCTVAVAAPAQSPWWDSRRIGVGLHVGGMSVHPEGAEGDDAATTDFGGGGLHVSYRIAPRWRVELRTDSLQEQLESGEPGDAQLGMVTLGAAFHLTPHRRWDWYLLAGFGGASDAREDATEAEVEASAMGVGYLGVGVERRWGRLGVAAELRALGLSPADDADDADAPPAMTDARGGTVPGVIDDGDGAARDGLSGGQLTIGATYYF